ncbi:MAG: ROK family protein [Candidatus Aenigmarchaeota archaeon]|nr:ROK family protein [Candidatus Aenigmarchaeota archaeon]
MSVIGIDVGATSIKGGKVSEAGVSKFEKVPTNAQGSQEEVMGQIYRLIESLKDEDLEAIGIGYPSIVDTKTGKVYETTNIPALYEVPLGEIIGDKFKVPVLVNNDANCWALGEHYYGKGQGYENLVALTIGSGLGGGVIANGKLIAGNNCGAGEFGEMPYLDARLQDYCSAEFFRKQGLNPEEVFSAAKSGDEKAIKLVEEFGYHLGKGLAMVVNSVDPELIVLGGSIANNYAAFEKAMWESLEESVYSRSYGRLKIETSTNPDLPILGAASLLYDSKKAS